MQLDKSTESKDSSITSFWLELKDESNVTDVINAVVGKGTYRHETYKKANNNTVYITGENNNYNSSVYYVQGLWAEE